MELIIINSIQINYKRYKILNDLKNIMNWVYMKNHKVKKNQIIVHNQILKYNLKIIKMKIYVENKKENVNKCIKINDLTLININAKSV